MRIITWLCNLRSLVFVLLLGWNRCRRLYFFYYIFFIKTSTITISLINPKSIYTHKHHNLLLQPYFFLLKIDHTKIRESTKFNLKKLKVHKNIFYLLERIIDVKKLKKMYHILFWFDIIIIINLRNWILRT